MRGDRRQTRDARYTLGAAMVLLAGVAFSTGGVIVRQVEFADGWQILFYRSLTVILSVFVIVAVRYRGAVVAPFRAIGRGGLVYALGLGIGFACFVQAITLTAVANVAVIGSTTPLFAVLAGRLLLGERVVPAMWIAIAVSLAGIGVMLGDAFEGGGLLGNVVALGVPMSTVVVVTVVRRAPSVDLLPATILAGVVGVAIGAVAAGSLDVPAPDIGFSALMGFVQIAIGLTLITFGARFVPAADVGLFALTETVLAPLWVWAFVDEVPTTLTLVGGGIVLAAVLGVAIWRRREERLLVGREPALAEPGGSGGG